VTRGRHVEVHRDVRRDTVRSIAVWNRDLGP
jgi:hypothetical protein